MLVVTYGPVTLDMSLLCMGQMHNTQAYPDGNILISLQRNGPQQLGVAEKYTSINQMVLLPGEAAPFSALFPAEAAPVDYHVTALLESALANPALQQQLLALVVEDEHQHFASGYFDFFATIHNPTDQSTAPVSLILTLLDANQRVIGYRYATTPAGLAPGERLPVALRVLSQTRQAPAAYRFTYEALPAPQP